MYLAYLDDSGTRNGDKLFQVLSAVIIEDEKFSDMEVILAASVEALVPPEKLDKFEEFHAWQLFGGYGVFEGVDQNLRFSVIKTLLTLMSRSKIPIVYGAVNKAMFADRVYGSADPLDVCFRICMEGIEDWVGKFMPSRLALLIADDFQQKDVKSTIKKSFRQFRKPIRPPHQQGKPWHLHDAMYFGDSKDSIGLQLADLCSYFIAKHLESDAEGEGFYDLIKGRIVYSRIEPS